MMRMLDLCAGLGGASAAFLDRGWEVIRVDNSPLVSDVPNQHNFDLTNNKHVQFIIDFFRNFDLIWASPPCDQWSDAFSSPKITARRNGEEWVPDFTILDNCKHIIDSLKPKYWVIENVRGGSKLISNRLQMKPNLVANQYFLWGNFPKFSVDLTGHSKFDNDPWSSDPLRAHKRAVIPRILSYELCRAIEEQTTLKEWFA